ncbi:hypothetical protein B0H67DRAFT_224811 [Lasiosphaeris hirsuta]|uniref:Uncharacterized protein n=1 Tax=Lasiosphaeris hirsuta TaxID=260670 RepID=A0AA40AFE9_9PEZI|nr:hypothetical protein B0H67DRAFT_224811 [Lasiosphaeris hirsuta]
MEGVMVVASAYYLMDGIAGNCIALPSFSLLRLGAHNITPNNILPVSLDSQRPGQLLSFSEIRSTSEGLARNRGSRIVHRPCLGAVPSRGTVVLVPPPESYFVRQRGTATPPLRSVTPSVSKKALAWREQDRQAPSTVDWPVSTCTAASHAER